MLSSDSVYVCECRTCRKVCESVSTMWCKFVISRQVRTNAADRCSFWRICYKHLIFLKIKSNLFALCSWDFFCKNCNDSILWWSSLAISSVATAETVIRIEIPLLSTWIIDTAIFSLHLETFHGISTCLDSANSLLSFVVSLLLLPR